MKRERERDREKTKTRTEVAGGAAEFRWQKRVAQRASARGLDAPAHAASHFAPARSPESSACAALYVRAFTTWSRTGVQRSFARANTRIYCTFTDLLIDYQNKVTNFAIFSPIVRYTCNKFCLRVYVYDSYYIRIQYCTSMLYLYEGHSKSIRILKKILYFRQSVLNKFWLPTFSTIRILNPKVGTVPR